jgi:hypothetical protein
MQQRGLATLWGMSVLLFLTGLWGWLSLQSVSAESTRSQHQMHAAQALAHSEALLETALAQLEAIYTLPLPEADLKLWGWAAANSCPTDKPAPQWQCMLWPLSELQTPEGIDLAHASVRLVRDVRHAPHLIQIFVDTSLDVAQAGSGSRATLQQSAYVPLSFPLSLPVPLIPPIGTSFPTLEQNEQVITPTAPLCDLSAWRRIFGQIRPEQLKTISAQQERNGLSAITQPARSVYWIDNPLPWTQRLGSLTEPVLLIFSETACALQCPALNAQVVGTVFYQSQCQAHTMANWQGSVIWGQLGIESSLSASQKQVVLNGPNALVPTANAHDAFTFSWPEGIEAAKVQRATGTWKDAGY